MAAREGQGLQIAVIIFAMLTIILAITTYICFAGWQTEYKFLNGDNGKGGVRAEKATVEAENKALLYRIRAYQYVLGLQNTGIAEVEVAKGPAGGDDKEVNELLKAFDSDKAMVGNYVVQDQVFNYRTLPLILLAALNKKNTSVVEATEQINKVQSDKDAVEKREKNRADQAAASLAQASAAFTQETTNYNTALKAIDDKVTAARTALDKSITEAKTKTENLEKEVGVLNAQAVRDKETITSEKLRRKELEIGQTNLFESPDGKIAWVNQRQRLAWIDVGRADGLMRQTTFSVFDHDINGVTNAKPKGRVEVIRLSDEHMAECRILEDSSANPILPGDAIATPLWSPGQRIHFAMAGVMDIDGDRIDDYDMVRNIITLNGGVIDAELKPDGTRVGSMGVNTRYLVLGDRPDEKSSQKVRDEFKFMLDEVGRYGTDVIAVQKLLTQMGWKAEERTVELAGGSGTAFRTRKPGQKPEAGKPAAEAPAAEPATPKPGGAAPSVDPFAAPAADPFAAPAPRAGPKPAPVPMPPAAPAPVDPFAPPK